MAESLPVSFGPQIQAVSFREGGSCAAPPPFIYFSLDPSSLFIRCITWCILGKVLLGTIASEIYEVSLLSRTDIHKLVSGHFVETGDVMGLAVHPSKPLFVTTGLCTRHMVLSSHSKFPCSFYSTTAIPSPLHLHI